MSDRARYDQNLNKTLIASSSAGDGSPVEIWANPTSHQLIGINGLLTFGSYDYIAATYPSNTTEVYTYKTGGASGNTVGIVTVVYTDSTKASLSTVTVT